MRFYRTLPQGSSLELTAFFMRTAQYDLQLLVQLGLVRKEGRGPAQRYVVLHAKA
jgi:hypothetical protein